MEAVNNCALEKLIKKMDEYAREEAKERERQRQRERMIERWKQREGFGREMGDNYCVLEKLNHLMISKACSWTADQIDHIDFFYNRPRFLAIILKDMDEKQQQQHERNHEAKNLQMQIYYVICKTRQLIRFFYAHFPGQRDISNNGDSFFDILFGINIMEEIKTIEAKVLQFYDQINQIQLLLQDDKDFNDGVHLSMSMSIENITMVNEEITVGFDDEALTIKELLARGKKQLQMISIVGMPGLGKTTLATKLYNDPYITHYFHIRAWTYASQLPRKKDMLLDILRSVNVVFTDEIENMTNEKLGKKLYKQLKGKRYLIVIDDLWDIGVWVDLKMYFPNDNNGSRVMFTSRLKELAMHASPDCHPHCLRFLTKEESWELLQWKVFQNESGPPVLIEIGKQIMKKCEGLPLAIVVMAGLLAKDNKAQESWEQVAQSKSLEEVAEDYLMDLIQRSLGRANYHVSLCSEEAVVDHSQPSILENLRTIANFNPCGSIQDLLARTPYLTKLGICGHLLSSDSENLMFPNLEFLRHLETLKLHNNILPRYPSTLGEVKFPANIKRLTLKSTRLKWEEISVLGMLLPSLELLKLECNAAWGSQWATTDGGFPRLKFLRLRSLNVKQWITCSSHFPSLQYLSLEDCQNLEEIPSSLGDILICS
ncbi:putative late blight resistance protein homolog R1B-8 [Camellia sinensis]|uniref:putative late blight resistance protein homolog R1B-8 n=1 Tax=Camellia sinensis TaxID=4442 RepID=UPI0010368295|nr:putative late blight resistance protein homolog R1B-8 [Camellia sinensis]